MSTAKSVETPRPPPPSPPPAGVPGASETPWNGSGAGEATER